MGPHSQHRTGLMAPIVRPLVGDLPLAAATAARGAIPAAEVLAALLDLGGSVDLAEVLMDPVATREKTALVVPKAGLVRVRLAEIEAALTRRFAAPFGGRSRIPDAQTIHDTLASAGLLRANAGKAESRAVIRSLAPPFRERLVASVHSMLSEVAALRDDVAYDFQASGPQVARLEALDRGLSEATQRGVARLVERLGASMERAVVIDLTRALALLPLLPQPQGGADLAHAHVSAWYAPGGCLRVHLERIEAVTRTLFAHERAVLEAMVATAWGAA